MTEDEDSLVVYKSSQFAWQKTFHQQEHPNSFILCMFTGVCILRVGTLIYYSGYFFPLCIKKRCNSAADTSITQGTIVVAPFMPKETT